MSNQQLSDLVGKSGKLIFVNKYGYKNEVHGRLSKLDDGKFIFHIHGGQNITIEAGKVTDFIPMESNV